MFDWLTPISQRNARTNGMKLESPYKEDLELGKKMDTASIWACLGTLDWKSTTFT